MQNNKGVLVLLIWIRSGNYVINYENVHLTSADFVHLHSSMYTQYNKDTCYQNFWY